MSCGLFPERLVCLTSLPLQHARDILGLFELQVQPLGDTESAEPPLCGAAHTRSVNVADSDGV